MTSRNISVTDDVYELLSKMKLKNESFSDTIKRLAKRRDLREFAGAWGDMAESEFLALEEGLDELRERAGRSLRVGRVEVC